MPFLINDVIVDPREDASPITNPDFPLTANEFAKLSPAKLAELARREFLDDPEFPKNAPRVAEGLAGLVAAKTPANALRIKQVEPDAAPHGVKVQFATLEFGLMSQLDEEFQAGKLTVDFLDKTIWSKLG